ncbi:MAG: GGDEF domain-containing protein [Lachnospiraceae bacterium]
MNAATKEIIVEEYKRIHAQWRTIHLYILIATSFVIAIMEVIMFFVLNNMGVISCSTGIYICKYILFPIFCFLCLIIGYLFLVKHFSIPNKYKNYMVSLSCVMIFFIITIVHGDFIITYAACSLPVVLTTLYGSRRLTSITAFVGFVTQYISAYFIHWNPDVVRSQFFSLEIIFSLFLLCAAYAFSMITMKLENEKQISVVERELELQQLKHLVSRDDLTGMFNRLALRDHFSQLEKNHTKPYFFAMIDVDRFKSINDTWGHTTGDQVLSTLGGIFLEIESDTILPFRYGGDEFCVIMTDTALLKAMETCNYLLERFEQHLPPEMYQKGFSLSIGLALNNGDLSPSQLIQRADAALYECKAKSSSKVVVHDRD